MRYRARHFLAEWEFEHVKGVARMNCEEYARVFAEECRDDAAKAGINKWALGNRGRGRSYPQIDRSTE